MPKSEQCRGWTLYCDQLPVIAGPARTYEIMNAVSNRQTVSSSSRKDRPNTIQIILSIVAAKLA